VSVETSSCWALFRETGEPLAYLLYRAERQDAR